MANANRKQVAHQLIDRLPDDATYDDMMRELYERQAIERGMADSDAGRGEDVKTVRAKYFMRKIEEMVNQACGGLYGTSI